MKYLLTLCIIVVLTVIQQCIAQDPVITLSHTTNETFVILPPDINRASITVLTQDVTLQTNIPGRWQDSNDVNTTDNLLTFPVFTANHAGLYSFYSEVNGSEVLSIQIYISAIGSYFAELTSPDQYVLLLCNNIFYTNATLVCATNDTSQQIGWSYKSMQNAVETNIQNLSTWDASTGISTLQIMTSQQGYYSCEVGNIVYRAAVFDPMSTIVATTGITSYYIRGIDPVGIQLLCDQEGTSIDLNTITWRRIATNSNYSNPVVIDSLDLTGYLELTCYAGATTTFSVQLTVHDPMLTLNYNGINAIDYNTLSPNSTSIAIPLYSTDVYLSVNIASGTWSHTLYNPIGTVLNIDLFTLISPGRYIFKTQESWNGEEREIFSVELTPTGSPLAITDTPDQYIPQPVNSFFYNSTRLVCTTEEDTLVIWGYQSDLNQTIQDGTATTSDGIGKLLVNFQQEGYYSCEITMHEVRSLQYAGLYDPTTTATAIASGDIFNYTEGIDDERIKLLCDPMDPAIDLSDVKWQIAGVPYLNPVQINTIVPTQLPVIMNIACFVKNQLDVRVESTLYIQGSPILTLSYDGAAPQYFSKQPLEENIIMIPTFATNVRLENNLLFGRWDNVLGGSEIGTDLEIPLMSLQHNGIANFVVNKWLSNDKKIVIKISVSTQGTHFGMLDNQGQIQLLPNGTAMQISDSISVLCATDNSNSNIEWTYSIVSSNNTTSKTSNAVFNAITGFSVLEISAEEPGQYTCVIDESIPYSILTIDSTSNLITLNDFDKTIKFVAGASSVIYYDNTNPVIEDSSIRWTTEEVQNAGNIMYSPEFDNPLSLDSVFNAVGTGNKELYCFYRMSPATLLGSITLDIRDSVIVTITYGNTTVMFDDASNSIYPNAQTLEIPVLTPEIQFDCSLDNCLWKIDLVNDEKDEFAVKPYLIDLLKIENAGVFALKRISSNQEVYTTAHFELVVTGAFEQIINAVYPQKIDDTTLRISWDLINEQTELSNEIFKIRFGIDDTDQFAGETKELSYTLTELMTNETYTILIELSYAFTDEITTKTIMFYLEGTYIPTESPSEAEDAITVPIVIAAVVILIMILGILIVLLIVLIFLNTRKPQQYGKSNNPIEDPNIVNIEKSQGVGAQYTNPTFDPNSSPVHKLPSSDPISTIVPLKEANEKVTYYSNLADSGDDDPYLEPIELEYFKHHLDTIWSQKNALEAEYRSLGGTGQRYPWTAAKLDGNGPKNKFIDTLPYDKSRVILMQEGESIISNYINASYIPGLYVHHTFIAAQGPKSTTVEDFWRMIVEHEVDNIVMVTNLYEAGSMKCERYFPTVHYTDETFGRYTIRYGDEDIYASYVIRTMTITDGTFTRQIRQFHFTAWPDHDVPTTFKYVLDFVKVVKSSILSYDKPILVHCSAGVGRTGTFITLFNLIEAIYDQQPISIYKIVNEMREHRPQMVQTFRQYKFIYLSVLELLYEDTAIVVENFPREYQIFLQSDKEGSVSILFDQFYELEYQCGKMTPQDCFVARDTINVSKNPIKVALPNDNNRVVLASEDLPIDYINASYLDAFRFIITIHPLEDTIQDFLQMLYQTEASLVIMLTTPDEFADIINRKSDRIPYWPNMPEYIDITPFRTEVVETEELGGITRNIVKLTNWSDNRMHTFTQIISTAWEDNDEVEDINEVIDIIDIVRQEVGYVKHRPIVIHCNDGIGKSGVLYTVYKCIQNLQTCNEVDIFQLVKQLRGERMNFVPSLINYTSCHSLLNEYFALKGLYQDSL